MRRLRRRIPRRGVLGRPPIDRRLVGRPAGTNLACRQGEFRLDSAPPMGIADLFRPKYRHSDVRVRTEAVKALTGDDAAILVQVARTDRDIGVRRIAIEKIDEAKVLAEIATAETERSLREFAGERAGEPY